MQFFDVLILFSSISFLGYGITYFTTSKMKKEFIRFGLEKYGVLTAILQLTGALGLLLGLKFDFVLVISSGGLTLLMLFGVGVRLHVKDGLLLTLPALFFLFLNVYIFYKSLYLHIY